MSSASLCYNSSHFCDVNCKAGIPSWRAYIAERWNCGHRPLRSTERVIITGKAAIGPLCKSRLISFQRTLPAPCDRLPAARPAPRCCWWSRESWRIKRNQVVTESVPLPHPESVSLHPTAADITVSLQYAVYHLTARVISTPKFTPEIPSFPSFQEKWTSRVEIVESKVETQARSNCRKNNVKEQITFFLQNFQTWKITLKNRAGLLPVFWWHIPN